MNIDTTAPAIEHDRGHDGKQSLTLVSKAPLGQDRREMRIETSKAYGGGIKCTVRVVQISECGRFNSFAAGKGGDYIRTIETRPNRATEKALKELHAVGVGQLESLKALAAAHYAH